MKKHSLLLSCISLISSATYPMAPQKILFLKSIYAAHFCADKSTQEITLRKKPTIFKLYDSGNYKASKKMFRISDKKFKKRYLNRALKQPR